MNNAPSIVTIASVVFPMADALFNEGADAWVRGNNSANEAYQRTMENICDRKREKAERIVKAFGIEVDYPGLHPAYKWNGANYYTLDSVLAAMAHDEVTRITLIDVLTTTWFQKSYGNSYTSGRVYVNGKFKCFIRKTNASRDMAAQLAGEALEECGAITLERYSSGMRQMLRNYCEDKGIKLNISAENVQRERDMTQTKEG